MTTVPAPASRSRNLNPPSRPLIVALLLLFSSFSGVALAQDDTPTARGAVQAAVASNASSTTCGSVEGGDTYARTTMSSLFERLNRGSASSPSQVDHARRLVADWQLLADLAFADLTLWVPLQTGMWWCVAQVRPLTAPTRQPDDLVGAEAHGPEAEPFLLAATRQCATRHRLGRPSRVQRVPERRTRTRTRTRPCRVARRGGRVGGTWLASAARAAARRVMGVRGLCSGPACDGRPRPCAAARRVMGVRGPVQRPGV